LGGGGGVRQPLVDPVQHVEQLFDAEAAVGEHQRQQKVRVGGVGGRRGRRRRFVRLGDELVKGRAQHARQPDEQGQGDGALGEVCLQVLPAYPDQVR
jgi:hypothetical protein